jgi:hypothetical protein
MRALWLPIVALAVAGFTAVGAAQTSSSSLQPPIRLTALAVRTVDASVATPVTITLQRWSTDAEAQTWTNNMREATPKKMIDSLRAFPSIGRLATTGSVGVDLRFARAEQIPNTGRQHLTLAADRAMGFWETSTAPRSADYPFMLIDIQLDAKGEGSGKVIPAAKIMMDEVSKTLIVENYEDQPVLLQTVKLTKQ